MSPLRWGIAGAGRISHDFVTAVQIFPEKHQVVAVGSGSKANAEIFAQDHNIPMAYEGYKGIAQNENIDVVYVGNLNNQHYSTVKLMLNNGKPVLCEKPFTLNEKQTIELVELARRKKLFLMEAVWSRYFPAYQKLREVIDSGEIGDVIFASVNFGLNISQVERIKNKQLGGGAILDLGVYSLQFQQYVYRNLPLIKMAINGTLTKDGTDGTTGAVSTFAGGKVACVSCSAEVSLPNEALIVGTKSTVRLPTFWAPTQIIVGDQTFDYELPKSDTPFKHLNSAGLAYEAHEVKRCLEEGKLESSTMPLNETIQLAQWMDLMRKEVGLRFPEDDF